MSGAIRARIAQLLQLCGEDPSAAFASRHDALPLVRRPEGWVALRPDGAIVFVDDTTGRTLDRLPREWRHEAVQAAERRHGIPAADIRQEET
jgi:hypothetical protein